MSDGDESVSDKKKESLMQASSLFLTGDMLTLSVVYMHFTVMIILHERFMVTLFHGQFVPQF